MFGKDKYVDMMLDLDDRITRLEQLDRRLQSVIDSVNARLQASENIHKKEYVKGYYTPDVVNALIDHLGLSVVEQGRLKLVDKSAKEAAKCL